MKKDLNYYRSLPYSRTVLRFTDEDDGRVYHCASFEEIPEVKGVHQDRLKAIQLANELFDAYVVAQLAWKEEIAEPEQQRYRLGGLLKITPRQDVEATSPARVKLTSPPSSKLEPV